MESCWPGVLVGEDALTRVIGRVRRLSEGVGAGAFTIETITKVGYRLAATRIEAAPPTAVPQLGMPDKAAIAVLPFKNLTGDPGREYLADTIRGDIVTALDRRRGFFAVALDSSFTSTNCDLEPARVGADLGVGYLVTGSVLVHGERVRVAVQLTDAASGSNLWAEKFDRPLTDVIGLQEEVTEQLAAAVEPAAPGSRQASSVF